MSQVFEYPALISSGAALPPNAATASNQVLEIAELTSINTKTPALGQAAMAASVPVALASDQSTLPISVSSLPLPTGAATETTLSALNTKVPSQGQAVMASSVPVVIASNQTDLPISVSSLPLPTGAATETTLSAINTKTPALGQALAASSVPVVLASDQGTLAVTQSGTWTVQPGNTANTTAWLVTPEKSSSSSVTSVASSASNVTLLSSNSARKNATFYNDSTQNCYLKLGTTASSSSFTILMQPNGYYELPISFVYTGQVDAIWAAANGNMRITELS